MSGRSIAERLQVRPARSLAVIGAPAGIDDAIGAADARTATDAADVAVLFVADRARLDAALPALLTRLRPAAILWLAYPKRASPLAADLDRDTIRAAMPGFGLDTVAQIAIDADWSALRLKRVA